MKRLQRLGMKLIEEIKIFDSGQLIINTKSFDFKIFQKANKYELAFLLKSVKLDFNRTKNTIFVNKVYHNYLLIIIKVN